MIVLGMNTGLRKGELFNLRWSDLDFETKQITVRKAKGRRFRSVPMNRSASEILLTHPRHKISAHIFHNPDGSPWKDIQGSFNAALARAGLPRIRIHDLRHSFVSNLVMAGVDLRTVQELAGHRSISTTIKYAHLAPRRLSAAVEELG